jgi:hypothetical protein
LEDRPWAQWLFLAVFVLVSAILGPFVVALWYGLIRGGLLGVGVVIDHELVGPVTSVLRGSYPDISVKWLDIALLVAGLRLDLLAL